MVLIIKKAALLWVLCFLFPVLLLSQEQSDKSFSGWEGLPYFENFTTAEHGGGQQSWDVVQDKNGVIYIANAHGVLTYDGNRWKRISINESFHIFQIAHQKKTGRIFTGGISEIGYIEADSSGIMRYHSLLPKIDPERRSFSRIQHCFVWNDKAWFITQDEIFIWTGEQMHYIPAHTQNPVDSSSQDNASFGNYIKQNNHLYIEHSEKGLLRWAGDDFKIAEAEAFREMDSAIFLHPFQNNKILAGTINNELYLIDSTLTKATRFRTEADQFLKGNSLNTATILRDGSIALGTTEGGLAIIDSSGQWRQLINMKAGLLTNDLSGIFQAKKGAIWLVMNNGIARLEWPAVLSIFDDRLTGFGDVSSLTTYKDQLYAGTFNGLFRQQATPVSVLSDENPQEGTFQKTEMVPHTVWDLLSTDNELLAATEQGIFQLRPELNQQTKVTSGVSRRIKYARKSDGEGIDSLSVHGLLSDHYASLSYDKQEQSWEESAASHNFKGFGFSMYRSSNAVWLATFHPLIYQAKVYSGDRPVPLIQYDSTSGLPASGVYSLGFFDEKIIAGTQEGTYRFLPDESKFVPYPRFNKLIGGRYVFDNFTSDKRGNIWVETGSREDGIFNLRLNKKSDGSYRRQPEPFNRMQESSVDFFYNDPLRSTVTWIGNVDAMLRYDQQLHEKKDYSAGSALIREVRSINNDSLLLANVPDTLRFEFPTKRNAFRFVFALPGNDAPEETSFRYYLEGFDEEWSQWSREIQKDYTNLPAGHYTFHVQGQNVYQEISESASFTFDIAAPWYLSTVAWIIYISVTLLGLGWIIRSYGRYQARRQQYIEQVKTEERERVRKKLAADFHDDLGNRITRISLLTKLLQQGNGDQAEKFLKKIEGNANALYSETREFIWQMDPEKDSLFNTFAWLKEFGEELFEDSPIEFKMLPVPKETEHIHLEMEPRGHIIRIFKEAMHNTLKHSQAQTCELKVELNGRESSVILSDNGKGIDDVGPNGSGNGLKNMRHRAEQAGGALEIISESNNGTSIHYTFGID